MGEATPYFQKNGQRHTEATLERELIVARLAGNKSAIVYDRIGQPVAVHRCLPTCTENHHG